MVKWLTVHNDGEIVEDHEGEYADRADVERALRLVAEMQRMLAYTAPFCHMRADYSACMDLVAQAEELLK